MRFKKIIIICLAATALFLFAVYKNNRNDGLNIKTGSYLAGGTIPADAKLYPVVDDGLPMAVVDKDGELTAEDIWEITNHVDVWATWDDTRGDGILLDEAKKFVSMDRIEKLTSNAEKSDRDYSVDAVQILAMEVEEDGRVQVAYIVKFTGQCPSEGVKEGTYESIEGLYFKKIKDKWYEDGIGFLLMAKSGSILYSQDDITGKYTIQPTEDYIS